MGETGGPGEKVSFTKTTLSTSKAAILLWLFSDSFSCCCLFQGSSGNRGYKGILGYEGVKVNLLPLFVFVPKAMYLLCVVQMSHCSHFLPSKGRSGFVRSGRTSRTTGPAGIETGWRPLHLVHHYLQQ